MLDLAQLERAVRYEGGVTRRLFMAYAASLSSVPLLGRSSFGRVAKPSFAADPFQLGVASGDPAADGMVLWTRLAPRPLEPAGGMSPDNIEVAWEVAADESMRNVVSRGNTVASPNLAHSVHVEVHDLEPSRWYWYRFRAGDAESPIGRTRTLPAADAIPKELRFAFASCQHYEAGLYTAYEHMAKDDIELVFHLGDYIYEGGAEEGHVRKHAGNEIKTLDDYRARHSQYRADPLLQAMHARCPWIVTWDDHEFDNDYANDVSEEDVDPAKFLKRRASAYQAYYEMMPLRQSSMPRGPRMKIYRKISFGRLAEFMVLDDRQYRSDQPNGGECCDINDAACSPKSTMLGKEQYEWLIDSLSASPAAWNVMAQQVSMCLMDIAMGSRREYPMDTWCGYTNERKRLLTELSERRVRNPVVLTGDSHSNGVHDLYVEEPHGKSPVVTTEFVGTSISSGGNGGEELQRQEWLMAENPSVKFYNDERGYVRCTVTPDEWRSDFRTVADVTKPGAPVTTRASFVLEAGQAGAKRA
jgi:alkaline phosphatase D